MTTKLSTAEMVDAFIAACVKDGWTYSCRSEIVTINKTFVPGDTTAYTDCDMTAYDVLAKVPAKGGSIWGTDGASIGGHVGCKNGYYRLNVSGVSKRFTKELVKRMPVYNPQY